MIDGIELRNWIRFRGDHTVRLGPVVYGVSAQWAHDAERSNWGGKSSFLEAPRFALFGWHRHRTEDDWITHGEPDGRVVLHALGYEIERSRKRGSATRLIVRGRGIDSDGSAAQEIIVDALGLTADDFTRGCYVEQKEAARFIRVRPSERMAIVGEWLQLGPVQNAERRVRDQLGRMLDELQRRRGALSGCESAEARAREVAGFEGELPDNWKAVLEERVEAARVEVETAEAELQRLHDEREACAAERARAEATARLAQMDAELEAIEIPPTPTKRRIAAVTDRRDRALAELQAAKRTERTSLTLARGEFDGCCPVGQMPCPVANELNSRGAENRRVVATTTARVRELETEYEAAEAAAAEVRRAVTAAERAKTRRDTLVERRAALAEDTEGDEDEVEEPAEPAEPPDTSEARQAVQDARRRLLGWEAAQASITQARSDTAVARASLREMERKVAVQRAAVTILGRSGVQRRIAEPAMAEIEDDANALLADCGIDLRVGVQWAREGSGPATQCDQCGAAYPASRKVKACQRCGAERGLKLDEKLNLVLSDSSGAADDLGGVTFQLAAAAWLRRQRESSWGTAFLDELFGALDATHRKALAAHVVGALRTRYGFEQALVVAHTRDVLDTLPGRIVVAATESGSTVRVET